MDIGFPELFVELWIRVSYKDDLEYVLEAFCAPVHPFGFAAFGDLAHESFDHVGCVGYLDVL